MSNMLADGIGSIAESRVEFFAEDVLYTRDAESETIKATPTQPFDEFEIREVTGINKRMMSFIVRVEDLPSFVSEKPEPGDLLSFGGNSYKAVPFDGTMVYKQSDPYGIQIRIYTVLNE